MRAFRSITALAVAMLVTMLMVPTTAAAQTSTCTTPVVDHTTDGVLDIARTEKAVSDARRLTGLDIYVRAEQSVDGEPEVWWGNAYRSCPDWLFADGIHPKPNVLVVMISMDRKNTVKYGDNAKDKLGKSVDRIRERVLGAGLREADSLSGKQRVNGYTLAVEDTLVAITEQYNKVDTPFDWEVFFNWFSGMIGVLIAGIASVFGMYRFKAWRSRRKNVRNLREKAVTRLRDEHARATDMVLNASLDEFLVRADSAAAKCDKGFVLSDPQPIVDRINALSGQIADLDAVVTKDMTSKDINDKADLFSEVSEGIAAALVQARQRAVDAESYADTCTLESKLESVASVQADVLAAYSLLESAPTWVDTRSALERLSTAEDDLTRLKGRVSDTTRADLDGALQVEADTVRDARQVFDDAAQAMSSLIAVGKEAERMSSKYSRAVDDVSEETRSAVNSTLAGIIGTINDYVQTLEDATAPIPVTEVRATTARLQSLVRSADQAAVQEVKDAQERRRKERIEREAAERAEREKRERYDPLIGGLGVGYVFGSGSSGSGSGGGSSGGDFGGGIGFGGGSSGSW